MPLLIQDGLELMVVGMTVVFALLGILVVALKGMSALALMLTPAEGLPQSQSVGLRPDAHDPELIAAVTAAVHANRRESRR
jgi:sodium pump decarboxylase gamma subunit